MASVKPLVLVVGATGNTGKSIVDGLLNSGNFRVAALVRPSSSSKPKTEALRVAGVEIRLGDLHDGVEKLKTILIDVDILISAGSGLMVLDQKDLFRAAKEAAVKRVIPCDFATPGARGLRAIHDAKLDIHAYIQDLGLNYTFIDVGWWMQGWLPLPSRSPVPDIAKQLSYIRLEDGSARTLVTDLHHIGTYVARIINDPRTLNHSVMIWEDEVSQAEAQELAVRFSGEGEALRARFTSVSRDTFQKGIEEAKREILANPNALEPQVKLSWYAYMHSMLVLGENTLENAKKLGYLDARELYPDIPPHPFEEFAEEFYNLPQPGGEFNSYYP